MSRTITVIHEGSEAFMCLRRYLANQNTYKVSIEPRGTEHVAIKRNEEMWTPGLRINHP